MGQFMPPVFAPMKAATLRELATMLKLEPAALESTVARFNAAVRPGTFDHTRLDDCATEGLDPPKTHWARAIDTPPYYAYPLRPGITFTYLGVGVDERARMIRADGQACDNVFAAGEIMAGNRPREGRIPGLRTSSRTPLRRVPGGGAAPPAPPRMPRPPR